MIERSYSFDAYDVYHQSRFAVVGIAIVNAYERINADPNLSHADLERFLAPRKLADYQVQEAPHGVMMLQRPLGSACIGIDKELKVIDLLAAGMTIRPVLSSDEEGQKKARQLCLELSRL